MPWGDSAGALWLSPSAGTPGTTGGCHGAGWQQDAREAEVEGRKHRNQACARRLRAEQESHVPEQYGRAGVRKELGAELPGELEDTFSPVLVESAFLPLS